MFSQIVPRNSSVSCSTKLTWSRSDFSVNWRTSVPSIVTRPDCGSKKRGIRPAMVVLPVPDGPTIAATWPGSIRKLTSFRTGVTPS